MTLTEIRLRLTELGVSPSRRLGQNFMHDQNVARLIVDLVEFKSGEAVLEIGPGLGALTEFISQKTTDLTLIEKDFRLASHLKTHFPKATLVEGDAMEELSKFQQKLFASTVFGNLPYSVASPLIVQLCEAPLRPKQMVFTLQLEVAQRLVAKPRTSDYGLLTLLTQTFYEIKLVRKASPGIFWPQPEVESAIVKMIRRSDQPFSDSESETRFRGMVKTAFQKRRKSLGAIFGKDLPTGMDARRRPEEISIEEWALWALRGQEAGEEFFDVVDIHDEVIGQKSRKQVHRENLLHRAVHIFVWNADGRLLLQKRSAQKDVSPNTWDSSAAGHLGVKESYDDAAHREIMEELGISPPLKRLKKFDAGAELGWEFVWLYEGFSEGPFQFPESEISEIRWWSVEEIDRLVREQPEQFARSFRYIWAQRRNI